MQTCKPSHKVLTFRDINAPHSQWSLQMLSSNTSSTFFISTSSIYKVNSAGLPALASRGNSFWVQKTKRCFIPGRWQGLVFRIMFNFALLIFEREASNIFNAGWSKQLTLVSIKHRRMDTNVFDNAYFNQHFGCTAPKRWWKYTTNTL